MGRELGGSFRSSGGRLVDWEGVRKESYEVRVEEGVEDV